MSATYVNDGLFSVAVVANNTETEASFLGAAAEGRDVSGNVEVTAEVLVPACPPTGAVASPAWATSDRSSGCVRDGCFFFRVLPQRNSPISYAI